MKFSFKHPRLSALWQILVVRAQKLNPVIVGMVCAVVIMLATIRGVVGTPTDTNLLETKWGISGPIEDSHTRGTFVLLYSLFEQKTPFFNENLARYAAPDLALNKDNKYVSLFAPGLSFFVMPGYMVGKLINHGQLGMFLINGIFALVNVYLIYRICLALGAHRYTSIMAGLLFFFATPALAYSASLYQHHITVLGILLSIYIFTTGRKFLVPLVGVIWGFLVFIDYPNALLTLPLVVWALYYLASPYVQARKNVYVVKLSVSPWFLALGAGAVISLASLLTYNAIAHGNPLQLSGTLQRVEDISPKGEPIFNKQLSHLTLEEQKFLNKSAVGFFATRNLSNGFYTHFISSDRGIIWYTPVILFGLLGVLFMLKKHTAMGNLFVVLIFLNVLLYSMWGDPWGGWAFGSRYLIPMYALLAVGLAFFIERIRSVVILGVFITLALYSIFVNTLGAITSNLNPPKAEVLKLEEVTGTVQKYTYERNLDLVKQNISKSYVYNRAAKPFISVFTYWVLISALATLCIVYLMVLINKQRKLPWKIV